MSALRLAALGAAAILIAGNSASFASSRFLVCKPLAGSTGYHNIVKLCEPGADPLKGECGSCPEGYSQITGGTPSIGYGPEASAS